MSQSFSTQRPETRYETVVVDEAAGFPAPGERRFEGGEYKGRHIGFIPFGRELYGRKFFFKRDADSVGIEAKERILGVLSRETPTGTMASVFSRFLDWAHNLAEIEHDANAAPQNLMFVLSGPGVGKTHLPKVMSKAFGYDHELIGSGEAGGDIDELVIGHEFKGQSVGDLFARIDQKLREGEPSVTRTRLLEGLKKLGYLGERPGAETEEDRYFLNLEAVMVYPEAGADRTPAQEKQRDENMTAIGQLAEKIGLIEANQSGGIGVEKVNGRLLTKLLQVKQQYDRSGKAEPVIITLDEFNRFKSFGKKLQNFWEVVGGASPEPVTLVDASGQRHTFTPDMLKYVFVYMTGNDPKKVPGARELDYSMLDRIGENRIFRLDDFSARDWQHRLEQQLMGIGIDMHYLAGRAPDGKNYWDEHPVEFTAHLQAKRVQGMSPKEERLFTEMQRQMLDNWDAIHKGTGQIADFFATWVATYQDPKLKMELRDLTSMPEISPRLLNHLINEMRTAKAGSASLIDNLKAKLTGQPVRDEKLTAANLGTKISAAIKGMIDKTHPSQKSEIRKALYLGMYKNGIIDAEQMRAAGYDTPEMQAAIQPELVRDLLNTDLNRHFDKELLPLQKALAEMIRHRYPEQAEKSDSQLVSLPELKAATIKIKEREQEYRERGRNSAMPPAFREVLLPQLSKTKKGIVVDFAPGVLVDYIMRDEQIAASQREAVVNGLVSHLRQAGTRALTSEVLMGLALADDTALHLSGIYNTEVGKAQEANIALAEEKVNHARYVTVGLLDKLKRGSISEAEAIEQLKPELQQLAFVSLKRAAATGAAESAAVPASPEQISADQLKQALKELVANHKDNKLTASKQLLDKSVATREQRIKQLDPSYSGEVQRNPHSRSYHLVLENRHPAGLAFTALSTEGFDPARPEGQQRFFDSLSIVSVTQPDPEHEGATRADTLIVGFTPIAEELKSYLKEKRHITYVCATDPEARQTIASSLKHLVGMAKAQLKANEQNKNHPDLQETDQSGLFHALKLATAARYPVIGKEAALRGLQNSSASSVEERSLDAIINRMTDSNYLQSDKIKPQIVTRLSWTELLSGESRGERSIA